MSIGRRLKLGFGGAVIAGGTVTAIAQGNPIGWISLIFFGGGLLVLAAGSLLRRRQPEGPVAGTLPGAARWTSSTTGALYAASRSGLAVSAVASLIFVVVGLAFVAPLLFTPWGLLLVPVGLACLALFGPMLVGAVVGVVRPGGVLLLAEGVYLRLPLASAWIPWRALGRPTRATGAMGGLALPIRPGAGGRVLGAARLVSRVQRAFGGDIQTNGAIVPQADELIRVLDEARHSPDPAAYVAGLVAPR